MPWHWDKNGQGRNVICIGHSKNCMAEDVLLRPSFRDRIPKLPSIRPAQPLRLNRSMISLRSSLHPLFFARVLLPSRRPKTHKTGRPHFPRACALADTGKGGKRKPPPVHRMRRLREPVKIHRRRRNCIMRAAVPSVRLYKHSFSGFLATRPKSARIAPAREIYLPPRSEDAPFRFGRQYYTIKPDLRAE